MKNVSVVKEVTGNAVVSFLSDGSYHYFITIIGKDGNEVYISKHEKENEFLNEKVL